MRLQQRYRKSLIPELKIGRVKSISVELRDVVIPEALQDAMSRQAQAERERQARIILASSEEQIAQKFVNAAQIYANDPTALNLRALNILYES